MNKLISIITTVLCSILILTYAGCGRERHYRIGVSQCSSDDWRSKLNGEIQREALNNPDVQIEIRSADDDNARQIADIKYFADNGFDAIIVAPNEAKAITPIIKEVYERGIPVVIFDRDILGDSYTARIQTDNRGIGAQAGKYALSMLKGDPSPRALELTGRSGSTPTTERRLGFDSVFTAGGGAILAHADARWNEKDAERLTDSLLRIYPDVDLIYGHNDRIAIGASNVARRLGRDNIRVIGIDAAPNIGIKAVKDSVIDATFLYPTEGHRIIKTALDIVTGKPFSRESVLPASSAVDHSNADILLMQNEQLERETAKMKELSDSIDNYWKMHNMQTVLLYAVLVILVLLSIILFFVLRMTKQRRQHQAALEQKNRELEEAMQSKLAFFTNVSHDLRTPLTLIADPVSQLACASNLTPGQHTLATIADKNVRILQRLINQILDFRKYETGKMRPHPQPLNFGKILESWISSFSDIARRRDITITVIADDPDNDRPVMLDPDMMERVVYNLVSNAIKYTPDNGRITVRYGIKDGKLEFSVSDTGIGIPASEIDKIFDNFYQVEKVRPRGSGIGLSLTKAIVNLHGGNIRVESTEGKGSCFIVTMPADMPAGTETTKTETAKTETGNPVVSDSAQATAELQRIAASPAENDAKAENNNRPMLLVIDDNDDMLVLISQLLGADYEIHTASNGREGLAKATRLVPDLIVCDVMMPVMNGFEFCRKVKEEISTSHIPVLLLTACGMDEQRAEGYDSGADGYISKPFSNEVLSARCRSLIDNRKRIRRLWNNAPVSAPTTDKTTKDTVEKKTETNKAGMKDNTVLSDRDNEFYNKFLSIFAEKMSDSELSVDQLAAEMGLGHSQFYRKIKSLTNYTPVELVRRLRLERSRELLLTTPLSISEIAYQVGFSTPAYFTKCFRAFYSETPSELRERLS